ncbi:hypothetical protein BH11MYX4_BH11MYX4_14230 [soil metagenome]
MTAALREDAATPTAVDADVRALAEAQRDVLRGEASVTRFIDSSRVARSLAQARTYLASRHLEDVRLRKTGEWYLDNYHLLRRVARQVAEELPMGFRRHLPLLASGPAKGLTRIDALARAFVQKTRIVVDVSALQRFVRAYQQVSPLTIAELWALPTMLRDGVLRGLLRFLAALDVPVEALPDRHLSDLAEELEPSVGVERSIRALRLFDEIDWKSFFERSNRVEAVLRKDPAHVYERMDFVTCDVYRKTVEELAWATGLAEEDVAERAVALARRQIPDERRGHVGYYLVDGGRPVLEGELRYRPRGLERVRRALLRRPTGSYLAALALATSAFLLSVANYAARAGATPTILALALLVALVPASVVAVAVLQGLLARLMRPRVLPKLELAKGVPEDARTLVVIPTLLGRAEDVESMVRQIERHYLANPDPALQFAVLTDEVDSPSMPADDTLLESVAQAIASLNGKHGQDGTGPFHLLHREPRWNPSESLYMGWERKRGKLMELNRLLRGDKGTSYVRHEGDPKGLEEIRFVVTVDGDTQLPMGSVRRLVGVLLHPLNRAVFDAASERVVSGYTIVQPRIETSPSSSRQTPFARLFAGAVGFDIYTHAVSDLYQDLFGAGIYVGKGIYDVDAFTRSLAGRVPENALTSHDLFEGVHGRTALATDIVLFEDYPSHYAAYARRMHRWVRGDWQLLPWLLARVPGAHGRRLPNPLAPIDRWKMVDNLRRSVTPPLFLLLLVSAWTWLPGSPLVWTLAALGSLLLPLLLALLHGRGRRLENLGRCALAVAFLAHEAAVAVDAVLRVLVRMTITRKRLLQWTSAAHTAFTLEARSSRALLWKEMLASAVLSSGIAILVAWARPSALPVAAPLLLLWWLAPEIARVVSQPSPSRGEQLAPAERRKLRVLARRTWLFFETFVGPNDQWLPVDNHQEEPHEQTAHRTSPTNIGMMLLSTLAAYDLGYLGPSELSLRLRSAFESIQRLEHYQGHLLNWYDTKSLQPLLPRYVSTVDSGNFAGCLLALERGCQDVVEAPVVRAQAWDGLTDSLDLLEEVVLSPRAAHLGPLESILRQMRDVIEKGRSRPDETYAMLQLLRDGTSADLDRELLRLLETGAYRRDAEALQALRTSVGRIHRHLQQMQRELDVLLPWLGLADEPAATALDLPVHLPLGEIPAAAGRLRAELDAWEQDQRQRGQLTAELEASAHTLAEALQRAETSATTLCAELHDLGARAQHEVRGMDFRLLFDRERKLFHIGTNVTLDQLDANHYDLMASEARLASYLAIVTRQVPETHWYALGRPMTRVAGAPALLSWGGTMFEYLMPSLLMRSQPGTLLAQTEQRVVEAQIAYGKQMRSPWGVSESAYARLDAQHTYQYQSFGVPGLGFRRGLEDDLVITPYASLLALTLRPRAVVDNVSALESVGMLGTYGLFEALDGHPDRTGAGKPFEVVRSYMAHHQGMILVALDNFLNAQTMVERFHANQMVEAGEMLLNERAPFTAPAEWPITEGAEPGEDAESAATNPVVPWSPDPLGSPQACVLTNGRLTSVLTDSGVGGLRWHGLSVTRFEPDATRDRDGMWIYVRDEESGRVWQATSVQGRSTFAVHKAEFHQRDNGISVHMDVVVAPADDVEVRQITLHNETDRPRSITVTSAAEPVLLAMRQAATHPAFSRMFVESERLTDLDALVLTRRQRSADEERATVVHRLVRRDPAVTAAGFETDRGAFFGRLADPWAPRSVDSSGEAPSSPGAAAAGLAGRAGTVIDPVMSLMARVELKPKATVTLAFVTAVARSRGPAIEMVRRYGSMHAVRWAFRDAALESGRRLQRARLAPELLPAVQRLFSALLFAEPSFRSRSDVLIAGRPCKRRLWGRGISGDDPIVLVRVKDAQAPILRETLAAQRYLRACGVRVDLVLVDEKASGYASDGSGTLRSVLTEDGADEWLNRHGGVYVLAADQLPEEERLLLEASARVVLDTRDVSLASRMERPIDRPPKQPRFAPTLAEENNLAPSPPRPHLLFDNGKGGFSEDGKEYVIQVPPDGSTPAPWCNVLANPQFGCLVSESSLGSTWSLNAGENRLTPWRNDPVFDTPSEALYLRDEETAAIWSPTPLPAGRDSATRVHHGAGYSRFEQESHGLEHELTVFVPPDVSLKVVRLRLKNTLGRHRRLTATYYAEWVLGSLREEQRPYVVSELDRARACLLATCHWNAEFGERVAFLASEREVHGCTADRTEFLGRGGDYARPDALERWGLSGRLDPGVDPCAALQVHLELAPGEELVTHFVLGQAPGRDEATSLVERFRDRAAVDAAWSATTAFWDGLLGSVRVLTPEPSMDLMLNRWLLQQSLSARVFGRTGFYQSSGAFGYRDQLQDVLAFLHAAPSRARAHILEAAARQFEEGDVLHWWHPPSGRGVRTRCSDDMAWLPFVTAEYVAATGDVSILAESAPFLTAAPLRPEEHDRYAEFEVAPRAASLFEHCRRALERASTEGAHGLPRMGDGDWNDGMNRVGAKGIGESVWLGWFLCATMARFATLCARTGESAEADGWRKRAAALGTKIESCAWDGEWYVRAFHDDGSLFGSASERECTIDSIAQSWAVLSGAADSKRARAALHAADERLVREEDRLLLLLTPPFDSTAHDPGYIRAYPPGVRENGGQYTHAATWLGWAYAKLGDGERAERVFRLLNPVLRSRTGAEVDRYRVEPYVLAADVYAVAPWVGRGGWTWYTGAAAWAWRLGVEGILGLRREDGMLRIDPCIPPTWKGFEAWIRVAGQEVHVVVENPDAVSTGVATVTFDGAPLDSSRIKLDPAATGTREVRVRLGAPRSRSLVRPRAVAS